MVRVVSEVKKEIFKMPFAIPWEQNFWHYEQQLQGVKGRWAYPAAPGWGDEGWETTKRIFPLTCGMIQSFPHFVHSPHSEISWRSLCHNVSKAVTMEGNTSTFLYFHGAIWSLTFGVGSNEFPEGAGFNFYIHWPITRFWWLPRCFKVIIPPVGDLGIPF